MNKYELCKSILTKYSQLHLLNFYDELDSSSKEKLLDEILSIDYDLINKLYEQTKYDIKVDDKIDIINSYLKEDINSNCYHEGEKIIRSGDLALITMAGGQGTRLGFNHPKGTYILNVDGGKSLFEIIIERLNEANKKYNVTIPWYIMTSYDNNDETIKFFESNDYFNYGKENISFFKQGMLPMIDYDGKIILESKVAIKFGSNGNGGIYEALSHGIIDDMKKRNIKWVYICGIDNILVNMVDPAFIGLTSKENYLVATKSVLKNNPQEKTGVFGKKNGKVTVLEYTEIPDELRNSKKENGELLFCEDNIVSSLFNINVLSKVCSKSLPYHIAKKKCDIINSKGNIITSVLPNAYKFEMFNFDIYSYVDDVLIVRVKREDEFAPIKNKDGEDSPDTAIKLYNNKYNKKEN